MQVANQPRSFLGFFLLLLAIFSPSTVSGKEKISKNAIPLDTDQIEIYKAVLLRHASDDAAPLNVSKTTYPLSISPTEECLKGITLSNLDDVSHSFHDLTADVLPGKNARLVDSGKQGRIVRGNDPDKTIRKGKSADVAVKEAFATALFSMSEIAFDKEHRHAVVSYRFWCGSLCGKGTTVVFEKVGGEWKTTASTCSVWVS